MGGAPAAHRRRLGCVVRDVRVRKARRERHPAWDFLFTYYSCPPGRLLHWSPGAGAVLEGAAPGDPRLRGGGAWRAAEGGGIVLDPMRADPAEIRRLGWIRDLLRATAARTGQFRCFGLHEWAMVYRLEPDDIRHAGVPLRLPPTQIAAAVESGRLCCSHYDAFRFFTADARPLNPTQPTYDGRIANEQPGCLHTNMDLYKWAYKLGPWCHAELLADAFFFALECRAIDMRASPYDMRAYGLDPIAIETPDGRREYEDAQRALAAQAAELRARLIAVIDAIFHAVERKNDPQT
ncbi:MAG: hypothetical protein R3F11_10045 [Verrucomicrobiales bacterium]